MISIKDLVIKQDDSDLFGNAFLLGKNAVHF